MLNVQETALHHINDQFESGEALPYPPVWELQGHGTVVTSKSGGAGRSPHTGTVSGGSEPYEVSPPWFDVRLTFADGAGIDVLAVVTDGRVAVEDLRADPPLSPEALAVLADRLRDPLKEACRVVDCPPAGEPAPAVDGDPPPGGAAPPGRRRTRPAAPRGSASRRIAAEAYRAAQQEGNDPVLAVMGATGLSRRRALRLIAGARDRGLLAPRHNRRRRGSRVTSSTSG
jgi:hypothetical protein